MPQNVSHRTIKGITLDTTSRLACTACFWILDDLGVLKLVRPQTNRGWACTLWPREGAVVKVCTGLLRCWNQRPQQVILN